MKKSLILALAIGFTTATFAQTTPAPAEKKHETHKEMKKEEKKEKKEMKQEKKETKKEEKKEPAGTKH